VAAAAGLRLVQVLRRRSEAENEQAPVGVSGGAEPD
jgi:hypothetical protein